VRWVSVVAENQSDYGGAASLCPFPSSFPFLIFVTQPQYHTDFSTCQKLNLGTCGEEEWTSSALLTVQVPTSLTSGRNRSSWCQSGQGAAAGITANVPLHDLLPP
jgi:hypothetical protein